MKNSKIPFQEKTQGSVGIMRFCEDPHGFICGYWVWAIPATALGSVPVRFNARKDPQPKRSIALVYWVSSGTRNSSWAHTLTYLLLTNTATWQMYSCIYSRLRHVVALRRSFTRAARPSQRPSILQIAAFDVDACVQCTGDTRGLGTN